MYNEAITAKINNKTPPKTIFLCLYLTGINISKDYLRTILRLNLNKFGSDCDYFKAN